MIKLDEILDQEFDKAGMAQIGLKTTKVVTDAMREAIRQALEEACNEYEIITHTKKFVRTDLIMNVLNKIQ